MFRWLVVMIAAFLVGCVGVSSLRISQPTIEGVSQKFVKHVGTMHELPMIDLHVEPLNRKSKTLMVFPIPLYEGERVAADERFFVFVSVVSKQAGQALVPQDFAYISPAGGVYRPSSMTGPFKCNSSEPRPAPVRAPLQPLGLSVGECYTMIVEFAARAPDPSERFGFAAGSLAAEGSKTALPVVLFAETTRVDTVVLP